MDATNRKIVIICGPTASGKTTLSVNIAKRFKGEIISADSRQVFRELSIGTAKPDKPEQGGIKHHFIDHLPVAGDFNASDYEHQALEVIEKLFQTGRLPIICGGSGLYIDALLKGFHPVPDVEPHIREELLREFNKNGLDSLLEKLKKVDPEYYRKVDRKNPRRVIRALEVQISTGKPYSSYQQNELPERNFDMLKIGLQPGKEELYERISLRCDEMLRKGLLREVKENVRYRDKVALKTIGYQEFFEFIDGKITYEKAVAKFKQRSRNYAKRQITWFKRDHNILWFHPSNQEEIFEAVEKFIN